MKTLQAKSGHTIFIEKASASDMPVEINCGKYTHFYIAKNFDAKGVVFFYLAKGHHDDACNSKAPKEIHVWYRNGAMWSGFGENFQEAVDGAQRDGWMHAVRT